MDISLKCGTRKTLLKIQRFGKKIVGRGGECGRLICSHAGFLLHNNELSSVQKKVYDTKFVCINPVVFFGLYINPLSPTGVVRCFGGKKRINYSIN